MINFKKSVGAVLLLSISPEWLFAQEIEHAMSGMPRLVLLLCIGVAVFVSAVLNIFVTNRWVNALTMLSTLAGVTRLLTMLDAPRGLIMYGLLVCFLGVASIYRYYRSSKAKG